MLKTASIIINTEQYTPFNLKLWTLLPTSLPPICIGTYLTAKGCSTQKWGSTDCAWTRFLLPHPAICTGNSLLYTFRKWGYSINICCEPLGQHMSNIVSKLFVSFFFFFFLLVNLRLSIYPPISIGLYCNVMVTTLSYPGPLSALRFLTKFSASAGWLKMRDCPLCVTNSRAGGIIPYRIPMARSCCLTASNSFCFLCTPVVRSLYSLTWWFLNSIGLFALAAFITVVLSL